MEMNQESQWLEAQKRVISLDLLKAAKQQLKFLAEVERNRSLYEGPVLHRAIYRYNACWLPLLARHTKSPVCEGPLVVPLDCEWVWHCHRLNPVQYKSDCEEFYGRTLDNSGVVSSVNGICSAQTEEIWNQMYPDEAYQFDLKVECIAEANEKLLPIEKCTKYDLVSAVKRQSTFFYQVSRAHVSNDIFLQEAVARYKGFLHLIKRNRENSVKLFCVPTYDIDLIWHTHQLHPASYCKDMEALIGKVLEHDDTDSDRTKGKKLDTGFSGVTKQWENTFGRRYWKAGAMYRGPAPADLTDIPFSSDIVSEKLKPSNNYEKTIQLPELKIVEVLLEIVGVKNLPEGHKGNLFVRFSKRQPDLLFNVKRKVSILSQSGQKQVAAFECEPKGEILFELISHSPSNLPVTKGLKTMGTAVLSLEEFLNPLSELSVEKWVELQSNSHNVSTKPICMRIAASFTVPTQVPQLLHTVRSRPLSNGNAEKIGGCGPCGPCGGGYGGEKIDESTETMEKSGACGGCGPCGPCGAGYGGEKIDECFRTGTETMEISSGCGPCGPCGPCGAGYGGEKIDEIIGTETETIEKSSGCGPCGPCGAGYGENIDETAVTNSSNDDFSIDSSVYSNEAIAA